MGEAYLQLTGDVQRFLSDQHVFFVATAPLSPKGHVNLSPKGLDTLRVLSSNEVAYLDLTGSGNETSAHLLENGRITLMACAFDRRPRILRVYGTGSVHLPDSSRWRELRPLFPEMEGVRQIVTITVQRVSTSCGYGVPLMEFKKPRNTLLQWARVKGTGGLEQYRAKNNTASIDGLRTHIARGKGKKR